MWGSVARSHTLTLRGLEGPIHLSRYWGNLRYRRASLGQVHHGLVISEEVGHTVVIWQTQREAARELSWILGVPVLESWVPWFRAKAQELARNQPLALGAEALYLPTWQQSQLIYALQEALRKGGASPAPRGLDGTRGGLRKNTFPGYAGFMGCQPPVPSGPGALQDPRHPVAY